MSKKTNLNLATRRIQAANMQKPNKTNNKPSTIWGRIWNVICWPFRMVGRVLSSVWKWICSISLVGVLNILLLFLIILLCIHIYDNFHTVRASEVIVIKSEPVPIVSTKQSEKNVTLPLKRNMRTPRTVNVAPVPAPISAPAQNNGIMYGDIIIDNRGDGQLIKDGARIHGNLYLQDMRKYILPCDIRIDGNLFLRDLGMLQFCGDFTITGNIYVSPRSSFGPIPRTARLGGQVIL